MGSSLRSNNNLSRSGSLKKQGSGEGLVRKDSGSVAAMSSTGGLQRKPSTERSDSTQAEVKPPTASEPSYRRSTSSSEARPAVSRRPNWGESTGSMRMSGEWKRMPKCNGSMVWGYGKVFKLRPAFQQYEVGFMYTA